MRFKRLKLNNITSLRGEHVLDFGEALGDEELFAITGATGSGKSSLLTAISLALYGNTYKKTLNQWEFVTQDEEEASIDLEFSSNGTDYRALWRCKKHIDKNGILRPKYTRELLANGQPTDSPIEDVVGLNFEQFKKTIILNQGQFAEFLTATFTERKAILENLAGAGLLSDLSKNLKERVREMGKVEGELEARLEGGLPFSDEELTQMRERLSIIEKELPASKELATRFEQDERDLKDLSKSLEGIKRYRAEEEGTKLELQSANDQLQQAKNELREWQTNFDAFKHLRDQRRPQLQLALAIEKELESKKVHEKTLAGKDHERARREQAFENDKTLWLKRLDLIQEEITAQNLDSEYAALGETSLKAIDALIGEWDEALKSHNLNASRLENSLERMDATKKRGSGIASELEQLKKQLNDKKPDQDLEKIQSEYDVLTRDLPLWEELGRIESDLSRRLATRKREKIEHQEQLKDRQQKYKTYELELENLQLKKRQHELEHALILVQQKGHDDGHCPACGQSWPEHLELKHAHSEYDFTRLDELTKNAASEHTRLENLNARIVEITNDCDLLEKQIQETLEKRNVVASNFSKNLNEIDPNLLRERRLALQKTIKQLEDAKRDHQVRVTQIEKLSLERENLLKEWNELQTNKEKVEGEQKRIQQVIARSINDLQSRISSLPADFDLVRIFLKQQHELVIQRSRLTQEAHSLNERLEAAQKEAAERAKERDLDAKTRTALLQEIQLAEEKLRPLVPEGDATKAMRSLEQQEDEWNLQKDKWNARLKEQEQKAESARTRHGFMTEQLKKARTELERILALIAARPIMENQNQGFIRGLDKIRQLTRAEQVEAAHNEILIWQNDFFTPEANSAKERLKSINTEIIEHNKSLDIDARKRQEMDKFKKELDHAKAQKKRWDALAQVLGQDEFRGFALGLVEERLVAQTNRELEHLCEGRYQITLLENKKQSQDFLIIDHWRGGGERKVSTLSGGETFLVSLAMALSLAELTRGQTEVDAFFIDEGFGTLDRDSIDDVLEVLSNVQSRGKQIGLISHVKALTDRIPVNLHLEKSSLGDSRIKVIYN